MNTSSTAPKPSRPTKRRRKNRRFLVQVRRFWQQWYIEVLIAVLVLLAVFLLVEQMNIRQTLYTWLVTLVGWFGSLFTNLSRALGNLVRGTTLSDLLAYLLLAFVIGLVIWRTRQRLLTHPRLADQNCPRCGSDMHRIHRRARDRLLNTFLPIRRYQCRNRECLWNGLRVYRSEET